MTHPPHPPANDPYGQPGHQPPGQTYGAPTGAGVGYATSDEKTWALIAHFGGVIGFIPPLVAFLVKGSQSPTVRAHALAALNFQIVCTAALVALWVLQVFAAFVLPGAIGWLLSLASTAVWIGGAVIAVIGGIKANEGQLYRYPIQVSLVK